MSFIARDVKDRVVQYPKRYKLVPVAGHADTYDFVPVAGVVTEEGTPINKAYLQPIEDGLEKTPDKTKDYTLEVITSSQNWIVPANVWTLDAFIVDGGTGGEGGPGGKGYVETGSSGTISFVGGSGGKAGAAAILFGYKVVPEQIIPISIGAGGAGGNGGVYTAVPAVKARGSQAGADGDNGGITLFDNLTHATDSTAVLGTGGGNGEDGKEKITYDSNGMLLGNLCILNGILYGGGGGSGGGTYLSNALSGGNGAVNGGDGGNGKFSDNPDLTGFNGTDGTLGGGGGGGGSAATKRVAGTVTGGNGGNGGDGVVVIRYREGY